LIAAKQSPARGITNALRSQAQARHSAARRCMKSSGLITNCVAPSRHSVLSFNSNLASGVQLHPFVGKRRPGDVAA